MNESSTLGKKNLRLTTLAAVVFVVFDINNIKKVSAQLSTHGGLLTLVNMLAVVFTIVFSLYLLNIYREKQNSSHRECEIRFKVKSASRRFNDIREL